MITGLYASIFAFFFIFLSLRVVLLRRKHLVDIGNQNHTDLLRAIRTHANAAEYMPLAFLLMLIFEYSDGDFRILHALGIILLFSRFLHFIGFGFHKGISFGRTYGMILNILVIIILALLNIFFFMQLTFNI